ncbi:MAG: antibiotic biosynthesis monooxygenase [Novosphingobium sp.]|nr:antibiotic biosynthesis monooxygenase [Novosphingobium sp.]
MLIIIAEMVVGNASDAEKLSAAAVEVATHTRKEAGCVHYTFSRDVDDGNIIRVIELWQDENAIKAHMRTPHLGKFIEQLSSIEMTTTATMFDGINERDPSSLMSELAS